MIDERPPREQVPSEREVTAAPTAGPGPATSAGPTPSAGPAPSAALPSPSAEPDQDVAQIPLTTDPAAAGPRAPGPSGPPAASGRRSRRSLGRTLRDLDPREVVRAGPTLPFVVLALAAIIAKWDDQAFGVLLPEVRTDLGVDLSVILVLGSILGTISQLTAPVFGYLADRVRRVWMLRIGSVIANASSTASAFTGGLGSLAGTRVGVQLGNAVVDPAGFPLLADWYPSRVRARLFAFLGAAGFLGAAAGPIVGGSIGEAYGWRWAVGSLGVAALAVTALLFLLREPPRGYQDRKELGADEETARREQRPIGWAEGWRAARAVRTIRRLWYAAPFLGFLNVSIAVLGLYYADEFGLGPRARGVISSIGFLAPAIGLIALGPAADRLLAKRPGRVMTIMGGALAVQAVTFLLMWAVPSLWLTVFLNVGIIGVINGIFLPAFSTMLSLTVPARIRGLGIQSSLPFYSVGLIVGSLIIGPIGDAAGFRAAFPVFIVPALIAAVILGTAAAGVGRDIASARAAALAEEEARRGKERGALLLARGLEVDYDGVQIIFGVDLDVRRGEIVALLGTNGAGKSTLLRALAGVHPASAGAIIFDGDDITHVPPHQMAERGIAMLPGGRAVFPTLTVDENLRAAAWLARDEGAQQRIEAVLDTFPVLRERTALPAGDMSGGEQQMLAIGQALVMQPDLLMIDELSLGLAPAVVAQLLDILRELHAAGTTIVLVEQSVNLALTIAERAVFMENGRIVYDGPTADLLARGDIVRSVFLGSAVTGSDLTIRPKRARRGAEREVALIAEDITVRYGGVAAVEGVSLSAREREIVAIIGPNGAGKTTLFDALSGFAPVASGRVQVGGTDVTALGPSERARAGLGRSFQHALLFPTMTVRDAIATAFESQLDEQGPITAAAWTPRVRRSEARVQRRVEHLIELVGLERSAEAFISELSTAMRRIVDLACVTAMGPTALLLDEPSSGLAQAEAEELGPLLRRLVAETGCGLLIIEHDVPMVSAIADRMIAMDLGRVIADGTPAEVVANEDVIRAALGGREEVIARSGRRTERE